MWVLLLPLLYSNTHACIHACSCHTHARTQTHRHLWGGSRWSISLQNLQSSGNFLPPAAKPLGIYDTHVTLTMWRDVWYTSLWPCRYQHGNPNAPVRSELLGDPISTLPPFRTQLCPGTLVPILLSAFLQLPPFWPWHWGTASIIAAFAEPMPLLPLP